MRLIPHLLFLFIAVPTFGQTDAFRFLQEKYPDAKNVFLYQSTLRALNLENNEDYNKLVADVDKVSILILGDVMGELEGNTTEEEKEKHEQIEVDRTDFSDVIGMLKEEQFVEVMSMESKGQKSAIYNEDSNDPEKFVIVVSNENGLTIADLKGSIDISLLFKLKDSSPEILKAIMNGKGLF